MWLVSLGFSVFVFVNVVGLSSATVVYKPLSMAFADLPAKFGNFPSLSFLVPEKM